MNFLNNFLITNDIETIQNDIKNGFNIKINSVAGSGKTTTSLILAEHFKNKKLLLLTYNRNLNEETKSKVINYNLKNLDVFTIHGFCGWIYNKRIKNDEEMAKMIDCEIEQSGKNKLNYDLVIIDEAQDLTPLYFKTIKKFLKNISNHNYQLIIIGDEKQCIYSFLDADSRYLTLANEIFINKNNWTKRELKNSFRVKENVCKFINEIIYKKNIINSFQNNIENNESCLKYCYWNSKQSNSHLKVAELIAKKIFEDGDEETFIIAPSVIKNKYILSIIDEVDNILINEYNKKVYFYITKNDLDNIKDKDLIKNKVVISTIHQTKGLERKNVFLFNFDSSYYKFGNKKEQITPDNEIYVALTRATSTLFLMHDIDNNYFNFINEKELNLSSFVEKINLSNNKKIIIHNNNNNWETNGPYLQSVTNLIKFLPFSVIEKVQCLFDIKGREVFKKLNKIDTASFFDIPYKIKLLSASKDIYEEIQTVIGSSLTTIHFILKKKKKFKKEFNRILNLYLSTPNYSLKKILKTLEPNFDSLITKINKKKYSINDLTYIAFAYNWIIENDIISLKQIKHEDCSFLTETMMKNLIKILKQSLKKIKYMEHLVISSYNESTIVGKIDAIDKKNKIVYEFKFANDFSIEYLLQLIFYKYLLTKENNEYSNYKYILYNVKNNSAIELLINNENTEKIVSTIYKYKKYNELERIDDKTFINKCIEENISYNIQKNNAIILPNIKNETITNNLDYKLSNSNDHSSSNTYKTTFIKQKTKNLINTTIIKKRYFNKK